MRRRGGGVQRGEEVGCREKGQSSRLTLRPLTSPDSSDSLWKFDHITSVCEIISKHFIFFGDQI